jgi:ribonucleoside-diphosphate reductase alpha chain
MESIMEVGRKAAFTLKFGGGTGFCVSELRPYGAYIRSTHGKACGPVAVIEYYHAIAKLITQAGKRQAAQMVVMHCDHKDIRRFIHCKDEESIDLPECGLTLDQVRTIRRWVLATYGLSTFNLSVACTDKFMEEKRGNLFQEMCESAWKTGDPGIYFIDTSEKTNPTPWLGKVDGTNACGEVPALNNEPCNLGSINLSHFVTKDGFNLPHLREVTRLATQYLDEVIDRNFYPDLVIEKAAKLTRKIGLGVMGWADTLALLHIHYDSDEAVELGGKIMQVIQEVSHKESARLGVSEGVCPAYEMDPKPLVGVKREKRNAVTTCIAPAGTISVLASCSSGIEPHYTLDGSRSMGDGTRLADGLRGLKTDFIPHTAHEIDWKWHIKHQAAFQEFTDLAVSKTINMKESATVEDVRNAFLFAWESKCKGITIFRDKCRDQQIIVNKGEESRLYKGFTQKPFIVEADARKGMSMISAVETVDTYTTDKPTNNRRKLLRSQSNAHRYKLEIGDFEGYLHVGFFKDGTPGEIFITASKQGSTIQGILHCFAIAVSMALQYGVPLEALANKMQGQMFDPKGMTHDESIPVVTSVVDYVFRYLMKLMKNGNGKSEHSGMLCPECGAVAIYEEGCLKCSLCCGWSRCG